MTARGLWGRKFCDVELREFELGEVGPMDALIEVKASGVCGTDLNFMRDSTDGYHAMGHELSGIVLTTGALVTNVKAGDKVVIEDLAACGVCRDCQMGNIAHCRNMLTGGGRPGLATHFRIDARCLVPFEDLSFEAASLTEPLAVGITAAIESDIPFGGKVVVYGHGPIGLFAARCALLHGASEVAIVGTSRSNPLGAKRLETAEQLGVKYILESSKQNIVDEVRRIFPGGADRVIVTSPPKTVPEAIKCCHFGGRVSLLGIDFSGHEKIEFDVNYAVFNKIDVKGVIAEPAMYFPLAIDLLKSKAVDPALFLTDLCSFKNFTSTVRNVLERKTPSVKICLVPSN